MKYIIASILMLVGISKSLAEEAALSAIGPGKAVIEAHLESKKFKLSDAASKKVEVRFEKLSVGSSVQVPTSALVEFQQHSAVYRKEQNGFIGLVPISVIKRGSKLTVIKAQTLRQGDLIATAGVALLRAAQLDVFEQGAGHGD